MKITRRSDDQKIVINSEDNFGIDLGWQEHAAEMEKEVLESVINPSINYETVRFTHEPYQTTVNGLTFEQNDIWFYFYFLSGGSYVQDYEAVGITARQNARMLRQATESFFRLEFFKTPQTITGMEPPDRSNRRLVFAKNLSLPIGEQTYNTDLNAFLFSPVFMGSNYKNKENMFLFWFYDDTVFEEPILRGDDFWMTAKFYNSESGTITDFTTKELVAGQQVVETADMYYKVTINRNGHTYQVFNYDGSVGSRIGFSSQPIKFYEKRQ